MEINLTNHRSIIKLVFQEESNDFERTYDYL